jgi:tRNA 2-selenouridine synthase
MTGVGKTAFLRRLPYPQVVDLEALANHRGSSFGYLGSQPAQQTFENALAVAIDRSAGRVLLEDESRLVGRSVIPEPFFTAMSALPRVELQAEFPARVENLLREYVDEPLTEREPGAVEAELQAALLRIRNRLGGALYQELRGKISAAFASQERERHRDWVAGLLEHYYDRVYAYAAARHKDAVLFSGPAAACERWLAERLQH